MLFFVLVGSAVQGPLAVDAIRSLPGFSPEIPVCPENRDHKEQNSWKAAASYPELFAQSGSEFKERDGGVARFWRSAVAKERVAQVLAAAKAREIGQGGGWFWLLVLVIPFLVLALLDLRQPASRPAPQRTNQSPTLLEQAAPLFLPARLSRDEAQRLRSSAGFIVVGGQPQIVLPADGRILKAEARFSYDSKRRELRPINEAARGLLDIRRGSPKS